MRCGQAFAQFEVENLKPQPLCSLHVVRALRQPRSVSGSLRFALIVPVCSIRVINCVLQKFHRQRGPAGLMARAQAAAGFAVKIFVEQNQIAPMRIGRVFLVLRRGRAVRPFR